MVLTWGWITVGILSLGIWMVGAQEICLPIAEGYSGIPGPETLKRSGGLPPVSLPFWDDFSRKSHTDTLWTGRGILWNDHFGARLRTYGCVTLDGLNGQGIPRNPQYGSWGPADTLLSRFINLSGLSPADSVFLILGVEGGGLGDLPSSRDSLIIRVQDSLGQWRTLWRTDPVDSFLRYRLVVLPLLDSAYFHDSFRILILNYATLSGNNDHWNLDLVYVDRNRTSGDTSLLDVAIQSLPRKLSHRYSVMPWRYFPADYDSIWYVVLSNLSPFVRNTSYRIMVECEGQWIDSTVVVAFNLAPGVDTVWVTLAEDLPSRCGGDTPVTVKVEARISASGDLYRVNDTISRIYVFTGALGYDDGTPEMAYGLLGAGTAFAYAYTLPVPSDTLWGIAIRFVPHNSPLNQRLFSIAVWDWLGTRLNDGLRARMDFLTPCHQSSLDAPVDSWAVYLFPAPLVVPSQFYAGFIQTTEDPLLVGFDRNLNARAYAYFFAGGQWQASQVDGAVMIRPIIGKWTEVQKILQTTPCLFTGISSDPSSSSTFASCYSLVQENPRQFRVRCHCDCSRQIVLKVFTLTGQMLFQSVFTPDRKGYAGDVFLPSVLHGIPVIVQLHTVEGDLLHTWKISAP